MAKKGWSHVNQSGPNYLDQPKLFRRSYNPTQNLAMLIRDEKLSSNSSYYHEYIFGENNYLKPIASPCIEKLKVL